MKPPDGRGSLSLQEIKSKHTTFWFHKKIHANIQLKNSMRHIYHISEQKALVTGGHVIQNRTIAQLSHKARKQDISQPGSGSGSVHQEPN